MVSKVKRSAVKSIKDIRGIGNRRSWRRKSPIRSAVAASSSLLASIHRRISKLLCKFTPTNHRKNPFNPYKILKKATKPTKTTPIVTPTHFDFEGFDDYSDSFSSVCKTLSFDEKDIVKNRLPPQSDGGKRKTVFLDLDETLVHSKTAPMTERYDFVVHPVIDGEVVEFFVLKRPGLDEFLEALAARFEVVVFTAALREYAELVLNQIDRENRFVSHRLYRDSCRNVGGKLVKDLSETGRDLGRVVIVDDNPNSFSNQPENAIMIKPFVNDGWDRELWKLRKFFDECDCYDDMRDAVKHYLVEQSQSQSQS